jgi:hypothetical protein
MKRSRNGSYEGLPETLPSRRGNLGPLLFAMNETNARPEGTIALGL